jgi:hypothetical protein
VPLPPPKVAGQLPNVLAPMRGFIVFF